MSNHYSAGDHDHPFQYPGGDARLDLTDLFVFAAPDATDPVDDVQKFLKPLSEVPASHGYSPDAARTAALTLLPDILHYDRTRPAHYPNARVPTDDVFSARLIFMVNGQVKPQAIKPHEDLLAQFPFMGLPHAKKVSAPA